MSTVSRLALLASAAAALALPLSARSAAAQDAAQDAPTARNAVYVELAGNGVLYSVNYDRLLTPRVAGRVGLMFARGSDESGSATVAIAPIVASYLFGEGNSRFEAGLGVGVGTADVDDASGELDFAGSGVYGTGVLGYRYQRPDGGFVFRAGLTPIFTTDDFAPWLGISFGYAF